MKGYGCPPLRFYSEGKVRKDVLQMLKANVRHSRDFEGDLSAQIGSVRLGERRLLKLIDEFGADVIEQSVSHILNVTEKQARANIETWKDGVFKGQAFLDDDGRGIVISRFAPP